VLRWLLPVIAVLALLGQSVAAWAASGVIGAEDCCCPTPKRCKCPDHGDPANQPELRRCAGEAQLVAPIAPAAVIPATPVIAREVAVARVAPAAPLPAPEDRSEPPEKPPF
jgi:hypothetical protein